MRLLSRDDEAPKGDLQLVEMFPPVSFCPPVQENQDRDVGAGVSIGPGRIIEQLAENLKECGAMCNLAQNHSVGTADAPPPTHHGGGPLWRQNDSLDALLEREEAAGDFRLLVTHAPVSWLPIKAGQPGAKLVYVTRDPRDVLVSNYFFLGTPKDGWDGSMNRCVCARVCSHARRRVNVCVCECVCVCKCVCV